MSQTSNIEKLNWNVESNFIIYGKYIAIKIIMYDDSTESLIYYDNRKCIL